jgi:VanZ family protein
MIGSLLPAASAPMVALGSLHINDKVQHWGAYLGLSLLPIVAFENRRNGIAAGIAMFLLGVTLEGAQHFSPGRTPDVKDALANGSGVACGLLLGWCLRSLVRMKSRQPEPAVLKSR